MGEIDLIARDGRYLVFVEVKYRHTHYNGAPEYAVDYRKQQKILITAQYYRMTHHIREDHPMRFDVVAIEGDEIRLYQNAFV